MWLVDCVERKIQSESHCTDSIKIANGKLLLSGSPIPPPYRQCRRHNCWKPSPPADSFKFVQHGGILNRVASRKNFRGNQPAFYRYEYSGQHNPNECHDVAVNSYGCRFRLYEINHVACEEISDKRIYRHQIDAAFALRKAIEEKNHHNTDGREHIDRIAVQNP